MALVECVTSIKTLGTNILQKRIRYNKIYKGSFLIKLALRIINSNMGIRMILLLMNLGIMVVAVVVVVGVRLIKVVWRGSRRILLLMGFQLLLRLLQVRGNLMLDRLLENLLREVRNILLLRINKLIILLKLELLIQQQRSTN